jgi:hypothetical protein
MSQDVMTIFQCYICAEKFPSIHKHTHHKIPRSLGGKDTPDNLVELCPQCHDLLHNIAYKLVSKKYSVSFLEDMIKFVYKDNNAANKKCMELAFLVRDEIIQAKESEKNPNEFVDVHVRMRFKHKKKLHEWAKASNISLEDMVRNILLRAVSDKFNMTIDHKAESNAVRVNKKTGNT